jgi:aminopeptidase
MTTQEFTACKRRYVELVIQQGCNVQNGQQVFISAEPSNLDLVELAAEACYARGARYVDVDVKLPQLERLHLLKSAPERRTFVPTYKTVQIDQLVDSRGACIAFRSQDEPELYQDLDQEGQRELNEMLVARRDALRRFQEEGVLRRQVAWCVTGPPSPKWAAKVFPELAPEQAVEALWLDIFRMTFADQANCLELWSAHLDRLAHRASTLNSMQIRELRFHNASNGTDLKVGLSDQARWVSGRKHTASGTEVCLNIPTFETYATPDWRSTQGTVAVTRPVMINGTLVEGLRLRFEQGELVSAEAETNVSAYRALVNTAGDATARRLGEVALVGTDSPIFQSGRLYRHTLYDENAACHIATGMAYTAGLENGDRLGPERLDELGFNRAAKTHQDVMISDQSTCVYADGRPLLLDGRWVDALI